MKRIKGEFKELTSKLITNIGVTLWLESENNIFEWKCTLIGPKDISYSGDIFLLNIKFPDNYPEGAREVPFKTPIYHVTLILKKVL